MQITPYEDTNFSDFQLMKIRPNNTCAKLIEFRSNLIDIYTPKQHTSKFILEICEDVTRIEKKIDKFFFPELEQKGVSDLQDWKRKEYNNYKNIYCTLCEEPLERYPDYILHEFILRCKSELWDSIPTIYFKVNLNQFIDADYYPPNLYLVNELVEYEFRNMGLDEFKIIQSFNDPDISLVSVSKYERDTVFNKVENSMEIDSDYVIELLKDNWKLNHMKRNQ